MAHKDPAYVIVDANGIGYQIRISLNTYAQLKDEKVKLHTHLMIKDDSHELYGFMEMSEKKLFQQLIGISGVGGNTALTILSSISPQELQQVIETEDLNALKRVKGIGAKTAGRIILELKGKLVTEGSAAGASGTMAGMRGEASMEKRVDAILKQAEGDIKLEDVIKEALKQK
ncbi:UNVERIFIED_CONTAM: hypothetical protein GTU68_012471 [Idotea baltica]|nr:hypothetical protein [Idotea baltica]